MGAVGLKLTSVVVRHLLGHLGMPGKVFDENFCLLSNWTKSCYAKMKQQVFQSRSFRVLIGPVVHHGCLSITLMYGPKAVRFLY